MAHGTVDEKEPHGAPTPANDDQNPAIEDARLTFVVTAISVALFALAALLIILATRMG